MSRKSGGKNYFNDERLGTINPGGGGVFLQESTNVGLGYTGREVVKTCFGIERRPNLKDRPGGKGTHISSRDHFPPRKGALAAAMSVSGRCHEGKEYRREVFLAATWMEQKQEKAKDRLGAAHGRGV